MAKEKAKHDGILCFLLAVIVVLILIIAGGAYYFLVVDNGKEIADNENVNNSAVVENKNINEKESENIKFSDNEIKKAIQEYLDLSGIREGSPRALLQKLNLISADESNDNKPTSDGYIKTNIKYSEYKNAILNYMTEEWFETRFTNGYKEKDSLLYFFDGKGTGMEFEVESITIKGIYSSSRYIANVYNVHLDGSKELQNIEFGIENNNGKCVISYCD